jgi:hypothetical protein
VIRRLLRRWLFPESVEAAPMRTKRASVFDHMEGTEGYVFDPETFYFSLKKVNNGWIVTMRQYPENNPATKNINGPGPGFTDETHVVMEEEKLIEAVTSMLAAEKLRRR